MSGNPQGRDNLSQGRKRVNSPFVYSPLVARFEVNLSTSSLTATNSGFLYGGNRRKIDIRNFGKYEFFTCRIRKEKGTRETKYKLWWHKS